MTIEQMRAYILKAYEGDKWKHRVSKMADSQIIAVYYSILNRNKMIVQPRSVGRKFAYEQLSLFDIY